MRFSRDNLPISNRPGEYANAQKYFGLNDSHEGLKASHEGLKASLWLVPTTDPQTPGAPIAITSHSSAKTFLAKVISIARKRLSSVAASIDGKDIPTTSKLVAQEEYTQLKDAIARADAALASTTSSPVLLDYQIYLLYLALNGSKNDIGARFGGFNYLGFENEVRAGTMTP
ncbi:hypothetical protein [Tatumella ptyseos]|uniref:hypothetical protein n=1 Tax=Tatumella ptyseos TaxID=82987 RepID=UPI0026EDEBD7|nr:hypothetical protein [Tatumella ptyseos]WKX25769.1 hypothetical protein QJR74_10665 [Tatumella ptyseos]